jgi:hypothetical protein
MSSCLVRGVPEGQAADYVRGCQPIGRPAYSNTSLYWEFFFGVVALFIDERKIKYVFFLDHYYFVTFLGKILTISL